MKKFIGTILIFSMGLPVVLSGCAAVIEPAETTEAAPVSLSARPQDDFYYYVNKDTLENAEFEYGESVAGTAFDDELVENQVKGIISDVAAGSGYAVGSEEYIIATAYDLYSSYDFEGDAPSDLISLMSSIAECSSVSELLSIDATLVRDYGLDSIFGATVETDYCVPGQRCILFQQQDSVFDVSFKDVMEDNFAFNSLKTSGKTLWTALGYDPSEAEQYGLELGYYAMDLFSCTDKDILMSDELFYVYVESMPASELYDLFTNVDMEGYFSEIGFDTSAITSFCYLDKGQLEGLNELFVDENLNALKTLELGRLYQKYMRFIAPHYEALSGDVEISYKTAEEQAVDEIFNAFYAETDPLYVEQYYSPEMDEALVSMCDDIREGYRDLISGADWLSETTRSGLLQKLDNIVYVTGMNVERHDLTKYASLPADNYYDLLLEYTRISMADRIASLYEPVDRFEVGMPMQMFNACYDPAANNITITVAIMNAPFFDMSADYYTNLGGLGMVIAHEMGHAFDSNCILFNADGAYDPSWISDSDYQTLLDRNSAAASYFEDNFTVFGIYHVDGEQTLGENYADLGGMECISSLCTTDEELTLLFENYARIWCEKKTDESVISQIAFDEHSPEVIRVNAILSTLDAFYELYDVTEGDGMYIAPEDRISRWY
ncbi:MAG: M13 family metallopeptidase [Clostridiales bacterium]|nr:M13 family metallopeptidase [Clostridiales bacterium]